MEPVLRYFWEGLSDASWHEAERRLYDCELIYISAGAFVLSVAGREQRLEGGAVAIVPPACRHESWGVSECTAMRHCIHFDWDRASIARRAPLMCFTGESFHKHLVHEVPGDIAPHLPLVAASGACPGLIEVIELALERLRTGDPLGELLLWPILKRLLPVDASPSPPRATRADRAVFAVKHLIDTRYAEPLNYDDFTAIAKLTPSHFCTVFRELMGQTPTRYLGQVRLRHAQRLLTSTPMTIGEVAAAVGFADASYFARCFRQAFGTSPAGYAERQT